MLERADVPSFPADDPPLHLVGRELHDRDGELRGFVGRHALHGHRDKLLRFAVRRPLRFVANLADAVGGFGARLVLDLLDELALRFVGGDPRQRFQPAPRLHQCALGGRLPVGDLGLPGLQAFFPLLQRVGTKVELIRLAVDGLRAVEQPAFATLDILPAPALFGLPGLPEPVNFLPGLQLRGTAQVIGILLCPLADQRRLVPCCFLLFQLPRALPVPPDEVPEDRGDNRADRQGHTQRIHVFSPGPNPRPAA